MVGKSGKLSKASATTPRQPLKQSRLAGTNQNLKTIKSTSATTTPSSEGLKQPDLEAFGFLTIPREKGVKAGKKPDETPLKDHDRKRRKLSPNAEIPETQFGLQTQSPGACFDNENERKIKPAPLSPEAGKEAADGAKILPPPITPKRIRVLEVPSSHSPPTTPLSPYLSQRNRSPQVSPTKRLGKLGRTEEMEHIPFLFSLEKRMGKLGGRAPSKEERGEVKSSQWWEDEESYSSTQASSAGEEGREKEMKEGIEEEGKEEEGIEGKEKEGKCVEKYRSEGNKYDTADGTASGAGLKEPSVRVDLSYELATPKDDREESGAHESQHFQGAKRKTSGDDGISNTEESFHSARASFQSPQARYNSQHDQRSFGGAPLPPSLADNQNWKYDEDEFDEDFTAEFKPVRTQQLPSSFFIPHSTLEPPPSSPLVFPGFSGYGEEETWPRPGPELELPAVRASVLMANEGNGKKDEGVERMVAEENEEVTNEEDKRAKDEEGEEMVEDTEGEEPLIDDCPVDDCGRDSITMSQLLPETLMETFPLPPPMTQLSNYELDLESETQ